MHQYNSHSYPNIHQSLPVSEQKVIINLQTNLHNNTDIYISDSSFMKGERVTKNNLDKDERYDHYYYYLNLSHFFYRESKLAFIHLL